MCTQVIPTLVQTSEDTVPAMELSGGQRNCSYAGHSSEHSHLSWRMEETGNIDRGCLTTATKHWTSTRCAFKRIKLFHYLFSFYIPIETFFYSHFFSSFSIPSSFSTLFHLDLMLHIQISIYRFVDTHYQLVDYLLTTGTEAFETNTSSITPLAKHSSFIDKVHALMAHKCAFSDVITYPYQCCVKSKCIAVYSAALTVTF